MSVLDGGTPWALPNEWHWRQISELADYVSRGRSPSYVDAGGVRVLNQKCIRWRKIDVTHSKRTTTAKAERLSAEQRVIVQDILWNSTGTGTIGRAAIATASDLEEITFVDSHVTIVRAGGAVDPRWLYHWITSPFVQKAVTGIGSTNQVELAKGTVLGVSVPTPPLETQRRIVARIDELFSELDDGEEELARAHADLQTYRKALLKAAVTGDLTADWRATNLSKASGADLIERMLVNRRTRWIVDPKNKGKKYKEPAQPELRGARKLPERWAWASYEQCCETLSDGGLKLKERDYLPEGKFPVIDQGGKPIAGYTNDEALLQAVDRPWILFGDHSRRFKFVDKPFCVGADGIKLIRPDAELSAQYIWHFFQGAHFEDRGYSRHFQFVRSLTIPVPPLDEQEQIVVILGELLSEATELSETANEVRLSESSRLRQSILAAAFRGELVS